MKLLCNCCAITLNSLCNPYFLYSHYLGSADRNETEIDFITEADGVYIDAIDAEEQNQFRQQNQQKQLQPLRIGSAVFTRSSYDPNNWKYMPNETSLAAQSILSADR
jgi:hypothetical protein